MKILLSESQLKYIILSEQPESRFGPEQYMSHQERQDFRSGDAERSGQALASGAQKQSDSNKKLVNAIINIDPHTIATIAQVAAAVLIPPPGGLMVAFAIGCGDAYRYVQENNPKMAGLTLLLAALPGIAKFANKIPGLNTVIANGMEVFSGKIAKGLTALLPEESAVLNWVKTNLPMVEQEYELFIKNRAAQVAKLSATQVRTIAGKSAYNAAYDIANTQPAALYNAGYKSLVSAAKKANSQQMTAQMTPQQKQNILNYMKSNKK